VPRIGRWQERATSNPDTIRGWYDGRPGDNLGLRTGEGLVALDVDVAGGGFESYARLTAERGVMPETATARTGSGGMHLLLRVEGRVANRVGLLPGLDVRGDGGQIVVAPSLHPVTGKDYIWIRHPREGIAAAPEWFVRWLAEVATGTRPSRLPHASHRLAAPASPTAATIWRPPAPDFGGGHDPTVERPRKVVLDRVGDRASLAVGMISRFPVAGFGHRHAMMTCAVGSLMGHGYDPGLVAAVLRDWHAHFRGLGVTRTGPDEAAREVDACIRSTRAGLESGKFTAAKGELEHDARCREIRLDAGQRGLLDAWVVLDGEGRKSLARSRSGRGPGGGEEPGCKRVTQIGVHLCNSDDERAFVEALIVHVTHQLVDRGEHAPDGLIRMTHDQLRRIAGDRREGKRWGPEQLERLKCKYITRVADGKIASRFELLVEVRKGERGRGRASGSPTVYRPTGIAHLLGRPAGTGKLVA
jgi:hypothetical protein